MGGGSSQECLPSLSYYQFSKQMSYWKNLVSDKEFVVSLKPEEVI